MNTSANLTERGNDAEAAIAATSGTWGPILSGKIGGVVSQSLNQGFPAVTEAKNLTNLHPRLWKKILKFHGIPELNSPMAG
jgi:hypothetical protein